MSEIIVGNMTKCREALVKVNGALDNIMDYDVDGVLRRCVSIIKKALAEPRRNCEVGTPDEQYARWRRFCDSQKCCNNQCPVYRLADVCGSKTRCVLIWAQMPYEEGGEK